MQQKKGHEKPLIVFDLDGTLVDTAPDLTRALNHVLSSINRPKVKLSQVRHMVGHGAMAMIKLGTRATGEEITDKNILQELLDLYLNYYSAHIYEDSQAFPNMVSTLEHFHSQGFAMSICTNKPTDMSVQLIRAMGLEHFFQVNFGANSVAHKKPDARHLLETVTHSGGRPQNTVMIGDSITDYKTARNAGIPVVLVDFGYSEVPVHELDADALISDFSELKTIVPQILGL